MRNRVLYLLWQLSIGLIISFRLKNRIPPKISATTRLHNSPLSLAHKKSRLLLLCSFEGDDAHSITRLIRERFNHFSEAFWSYVFEEPFDVWARKSFVGVETEGSIFNENWPFGLLKGNVDFFSCDFEGISLQLWY